MEEPVIISASRASDIPAFYLRWFTDKFRFIGYLNKKNPFSGKVETISLKKVRVIVFWTKNPQQYEDKLEFFNKKRINYYFQYTLNDYEREKLEPGLPNLNTRIKNFIDLSRRIGKEKVIWRFDPLILGGSLTVEELLSRIEKIAEKIHLFTEKLVISFIDIEKYKKVKKRMPETFREFNVNEIEEFSAKLQELNKNWNLKIATCAEKIDLEKYGIEHNKCIDDELMIKLFKKDRVLMDFLQADKDRKEVYKKLKDKGQRKECGCIKSKDIGIYGSCQFVCVYCYAK